MPDEQQQESSREQVGCIFEGSLEVVNRDGIGGWAWNSAWPNSPVRVDVFADDEMIISGVLANQYRADLLEAGKGTGKHGFQVQMPEELMDGKARAISVKIWGQWIELIGSPQTFSCEG